MEGEDTFIEDVQVQETEWNGMKGEVVKQDVFVDEEGNEEDDEEKVWFVRKVVRKRVLVEGWEMVRALLVVEGGELRGSGAVGGVLGEGDEVVVDRVVRGERYEVRAERGVVEEGEEVRSLRGVVEGGEERSEERRVSEEDHAVLPKKVLINPLQ